jgi:uncharacterized protein (DUF934 family)
MHHLIKDGAAVANDPWQFFAAGDADGIPAAALLPVSMWAGSGAELAKSARPFGVCIEADDSFDGILAHLTNIAVVAFHFTKFADGRAFRYAHQLREQFGYRGEIRATGDFMPDQVGYLERCGFNAFACRSKAEQQTALSIRGSLPINYQADVLETQPLFRRR